MPCLLVVLKREPFAVCAQVVFLFCLFFLKIFTCFLLKTKLLSVVLNHWKITSLKKSPKCGEKIQNTAIILSPIQFPPPCPGRLRGLSGCLGREEAEVGPVSAACCWGLAEGEQCRITEGEEPKWRKGTWWNGSASGAEFKLVLVQSRSGLMGDRPPQFFLVLSVLSFTRQPPRDQCILTLI